MHYIGTELAVKVDSDMCSYMLRMGTVQHPCRRRLSSYAELTPKIDLSLGGGLSIGKNRNIDTIFNLDRRLTL